MIVGCHVQGYPHEEDPSHKHCTNTQKLINLAMNHWRKCLEMSIIPKLHGIKAHVMMQMLDIKGGIYRLIEHWAEQYSTTRLVFVMT